LTLSNIAEFALRMRVSMSAIGQSCHVCPPTNLLRDAGNLTGVDHHAQAIRHRPNLRYTNVDVHSAHTV